MRCVEDSSSDGKCVSTPKSRQANLIPLGYARGEVGFTCILWKTIWQHIENPGSSARSVN